MYYDIQPESMLPKRRSESHKGTYGRVLLIAGSHGMAGAAYLAGLSAYRSGCGLVEIFTHEDNRVILQELLPEAVMTTYQNETADSLSDKLNHSLGKADAIAIGCGIGLDETASLLLSQTCRYISVSEIPCVIDADAITLLSRRADLMACLAGRKAVVTPHPKEMATLIHTSIDEVQEDREQTVERFVHAAQISCLLKGYRTLVGSPDHELYMNLSGNDGMATGGSGDVLTGLIAGLAAQGEDICEAAVLGAYVHGAAGDYAAGQMGRHSLLARDVIAGICEIIKVLEKKTNEKV